MHERIDKCYATAHNIISINKTGPNMGRIEKLMEEHWTERRPAPLVLTDTEILDFLEKYFTGITRGDANRVILDIDNMTTREWSIRQAACLAAAKIEEESKL